MIAIIYAYLMSDERDTMTTITAPAPLVWNREAKTSTTRQRALCRCEQHHEVCYAQTVMEGLAASEPSELTKTNKEVSIETLLDAPGALFTGRMREAFVKAANGETLFYRTDGWRGYTKTVYALAASGQDWAMGEIWHELKLKEADEKAKQEQTA